MIKSYTVTFLATRELTIIVGLRPADSPRRWPSTYVGPTVNVGFSGLVVAQQLYRRTTPLQIFLPMDTVRVLHLRLVRAGGLEAVRKWQRRPPPLVPSSLLADPALSGPSHRASA